jgi:hypothetical protein
MSILRRETKQPPGERNVSHRLVGIFLGSVSRSTGVFLLNRESRRNAEFRTPDNRCSRIRIDSILAGESFRAGRRPAGASFHNGGQRGLSWDSFCRLPGGGISKTLKWIIRRTTFRPCANVANAVPI